MRKETKDGVSTLTVSYLETEEGSRYHSESKIPLFRPTVTPLAIFGDGHKVRQGNKVVAPEDCKHSERTSARGICKWMGRRVALT
jgi:hypothetical protein